MAVQICPACFAKIPNVAQQCKACGADIARLSARDYQEKLIAALSHPLADVRMRAIIALGVRGESEGADPLVQCALRHPTDLVEGLEIVRTLARLRAPDVRSKFLGQLARRHPAHTVQAAAEMALHDVKEEHADQ
jgi:ribosomal protein L40E